jgi:PIN domain nuclease of toxin-antitoxin system
MDFGLLRQCTAHSPFDRILIAQAQTERMVLLSKDAKFSAYDVQTIW